MRNRTCIARIEALTLALVLASVVRAQGTRGELPDPITGMRLMIYADMLNLSPQQQHALDDAHAAYRAEFQMLRETEIDDWIKSQGVVFTRARLAGKRRMLQRIAATDDRFFDAMIPLLADEQVARLPRVRAMRQRERAMQVDGVWSWMDAQPVDLSQLIGEMALPAEQMAGVDATLAAYESTLTARFDAFVDEYFRQMDIMFDAWEQAGWTEKRREENKDSFEPYEVVQPLSNEGERRQHAMMKELIALNERTLRSLQAQLPAATFQPMRKAFICGMNDKIQYFNLLPALVNTTSPYEKALARPNLTEEQRATLLPLAAAFDQVIDDAVEAMLSKVDSYRETYVGNSDRKAEYESRTQIEREIEAAWQTLMQRSREERASIEALIGKQPEKPKEDIDLGDVNLATIDAWRLVFESGGLTGSTPTPISESDLRTYARYLGLSDADVATLQGPHAKYKAAYDEAKQRDTQPLREASDALYAGDTVEGYTRENLARLRSVREVAEREQRATEDAFFADIEAAMHRPPDDPAMRRVRQSRERRWLTCSYYDSRIEQEGNRMDGSIDLERMACRIRDIDIADPTVDRILREYADHYLPLVQIRSKAATEFRELDDASRVEWQELRVASGDKNAYPSRARLDELGIAAKTEAARRALDPIAELNQTTVKRLCEAMPPASAERVRRAFERLAWPRIYEDRSAAGPLLSAALTLDDLTFEQHATIEQIAAEYRPAYDAMCEKMKSMVEQRGSWAYDQEHASDEQRIGNMRRMSDRQCVLFERHEMNVRAWRQVKGALTAEQGAAVNIGAMPPDGPHEGEDFGW